jgi:hypothetical protein
MARWVKNGFGTVSIFLFAGLWSNSSAIAKTENHFVQTRDVPNIRTLIETSTRVRWKSVIGFAGYSDSGYESPQAAEKVWEQILSRVPGADRAKTLVLTGGTASGVGQVAELATRMGFSVGGLASENALTEAISPQIKHMFFIKDKAWGGTVEGSAKLHPTSHALALVVDQLHVVGGGEVAAMEYVSAKLLGKEVSFTPADMNHSYAKNRNVAPEGAAYDIIVPERTQTAKLMHDMWRDEFRRADGTYTPAPRTVVEAGVEKTVDLANLEFEQLPQFYKDLNLQSAEISIAAIQNSQRGNRVNLEEVGRDVHRAYLKRVYGLRGKELESRVGNMSADDRAKVTVLVRVAVAERERLLIETTKAGDLLALERRQVAELVHEKWREGLRRADGTYVPAPRTVVVGGIKRTVDIAAMPFDQLPQFFKDLNLQTADTVLQALTVAQSRGSVDVDSVVKLVHRNYLISRKGLNGPELEVEMAKFLLPEASAEREKAGRLVRATLEFRERHSVKNQVIFGIADRMHENWRSKRSLDSSTGQREPRFKQFGRARVDIANLSFSELPLEEQYRNLIVAKATFEQLELENVRAPQALTGLREQRPEALRRIYQSVHDAYLSVNGLDSKTPFEKLPRAGRTSIESMVSIASEELARFDLKAGFGKTATTVLRSTTCIPGFQAVAK